MGDVDCGISFKCTELVVCTLQFTILGSFLLGVAQVGASYVRYCAAGSGVTMSNNESQISPKWLKKNEEARIREVNDQQDSV